MRLLFMMELVLATAVGLGLARWRVTGPVEISVSWDNWRQLLNPVGEGFFSGFGLVVGLGTWVEAARRRWQLAWGPGRWVWSTVALYLVFRNASFAPVLIAFSTRGVSVVQIVIMYINSEFVQTVPWFLAALLVTRLGGRPAPGPVPDGREWAGRAYAALLIGFRLFS